MSRLSVRTRIASIATLLVAVLVAAAAVMLTASSSSATATFRTAVAGERSVDQVLDEVGTIDPVTFADVAFPAAGTVATVEVGPGDSVTTGQVLATLDPASLETAVREAQAALDRAELDLERARNGESGTGGVGLMSGSAGGASSSAAIQQVSVTATTAVAPPTSPVGDGTGPAVDEELYAAQQAVLDAQTQVSVGLNAAQEALDSAHEVCAAEPEPSPEPTPDPTDEPSPEPTEAPTSDPEPEPTEEPTTSSTTVPSGPAPSDPEPTSTATIETALFTTRASSVTVSDPTSATGLCGQALEDALEAQQSLQAAQRALANAVSDYSALVAERVRQQDGSVPPSTQAPDDGSGTLPQGGGAPSGGTLSGGAPSGSGSTPGGSAGGSSSTSTPSAERLIAYQAAIDSASANLIVAQAAVRQASIVSPIDGTVASVSIAPGDVVDAASDTAVIGIDGDQGFEVTAIVGVEDLIDLEVGQPATITPDGTDLALAGKVVRVGLTGTADTGGTTFPVTISIDDQAEELRQGSVASISVVLGRGENVLTVPTSAVRASGGVHSVTVLRGAETEEVTVEIGVIGAAWTEIRSGITAGDVVVLADLGLPLPGSATDSGTGSGSNGDVRMPRRA